MAKHVDTAIDWVSESTNDLSTSIGDEPDAAAQVDTGGAYAPDRPASSTRSLLVLGLAMVLALSGIGAWLGWRAYGSIELDDLRQEFVEVARQGALNLTTIDAATVDADVRRVLDGATGAFHDEFAERAQPFIEVVQQAQSKTVGTIIESGLEALLEDEGHVLVAVSVQNSMAGTPDPTPRAWRMRVSVKKIEDDVKVSNVQFVP